MELYILAGLNEVENEPYTRVGYIDYADSVLWIKKYNDVGECEIYISCDDEVITELRIGRYVYREDDDMICKIESVTLETDVENGDHLIVVAKDVVSLLSNRIVKLESTYSGTVFGFISKLLEENVINPTDESRKISKVMFDLSNIDDFTETITVSTFAEDLLELIKSTCKTYNYGFRIRFLKAFNLLQFQLYKGVNKATDESEMYVEFSPRFSNIITSNYKEDEGNLKNVCYVGYKKSTDSNEVALEPVFIGEEPSSEDRREIYVDGSGTNREITVEELQKIFPTGLIHMGAEWYHNGTTVVAAVDKDENKVTITDYTYMLLIRTLGYNTLAERVKTLQFSGEVDTINTYEYKTDYNVGDVVRVTNEYGISAPALVTEVIESDDDDNGYQIEPKFEYVN